MSRPLLNAFFTGIECHCCLDEWRLGGGIRTDLEIPFTYEHYKESYEHLVALKALRVSLHGIVILTDQDLKTAPITFITKDGEIDYPRQFRTDLAFVSESGGMRVYHHMLAHIIWTANLVTGQSKCRLRRVAISTLVIS